MGGTVALTIRTSETECYRGSCWTNVLPEGLFAPDFYRDLDTSRNHAKAWLARLLAHRAADADLEDLWGGHGLLAPTGYGIVLVDYVTNTFVSAQCYTNPGALFVFADSPSPRDVALADAGLLTRVPTPPRQSAMTLWRITLPFVNVQNGEPDEIITPALMAWCETHFGLSDAERAAWDAWFAERDA